MKRPFSSPGAPPYNFGMSQEDERTEAAALGLGGEDRVLSVASAGEMPLCLLTPDMQNRRIVDAQLAEVGANVIPRLESDSVIVLIAHVRTGKWTSVMPARLAEVLGVTKNVRAIPIVDPVVTHSIGLVVPHRNPLTPLINALVAEAKQLAPVLEGIAAVKNAPEILDA